MANNPQKLITLMDATKFCDYSQEYLSLRARRGKLKAIKKGKVWFTKTDWLDEYIKKTESYKLKVALKRKEVLHNPGLRSYAIRDCVSKLPVEEINIDKPKKLNLSLHFLKFGFSLGLVIGIIASSLIVSKGILSDVSYLAKNYSSVSPYIYETFKNYIGWLKKESLSSNMYAKASELPLNKFSGIRSLIIKIIK